MSETDWKDALRNLLALKRLTARIALSAGLLGLASQATPDALAQPRVPVSPVLTPEATVRKFKGRYVLKRSATSFFVHLAGHRSHSSHSSHGSHSSHVSHSSSSHYSNAHASHYSSSSPPQAIPDATPAPQPPAPQPPAPQPAVQPTRPKPQPKPQPKPKPQPLLREDFETTEPLAERWRIGVLATPPETFDSNIATEQTRGTLSISPVAHTPGAHFSGYVSIASFDLHACSIAVQLRRPAGGAATIFAAATDSGNWVGFRIEGAQLSIESHSEHRVASRKIPYSASQHRFLRLRTSNVAAVVVWETSADGVNWTPEYVEKESISVKALRIALSAGTTQPAAITGPATFDNVTVEPEP